MKTLKDGKLAIYSIQAILVSVPLIQLWFSKRNDLRIFSDSVTYLVAADNYLKDIDFIPPTGRPTGFTRIWAFSLRFSNSGEAIVVTHILFLIFSVVFLALVLNYLRFSPIKILLLCLALELNPQNQYYLHMALAESLSYSLTIFALSVFLLRNLLPRKYVYLIILALLFAGGLVLRYSFFWVVLVFIFFVTVELLRYLDFSNYQGRKGITSLSKLVAGYSVLGALTAGCALLVASLISGSTPAELLIRPVYASTFTNLAKVAPLLDCQQNDYSTFLKNLCAERLDSKKPFGFDEFLYDSKVQEVSNLNPKLETITSVTPLKLDVFKVIVSKPSAYAHLIINDFVKILNPAEESYIGRVDTENSPYSDLVQLHTSREIDSANPNDRLFDWVKIQTAFRFLAIISLLFSRKRTGLKAFYGVNFIVLALIAFPSPRYLFPLDPVLLMAVVLNFRKSV